MARDSRSTSRPGSRTRSRASSSRATTRPALKSKTTAVGGGGRATRARRSPRSMRRMTIMGALIVFLAVLITPTLHNYLQRKSRIDQLQGHVAAQRHDVADKKAALKKWDDPDYVRQQARKRLGFVEPGKARTVIVDKDANAHPATTTGNGVSVKLPWYGKIWQSAVNADHPSTP